MFRSLTFYHLLAGLLRQIPDVFGAGFIMYLAILMYGQVVLGAQADGAYAQWPIFVQANKIDASKVKIENIGFPVREPMLAQGKVDAITGFWFSSYMNLKAQGIAEETLAGVPVLAL